MAFWNRWIKKKNKPAHKKDSAVQGIMVSGMQEAIYPERNYANFAKEGYIENVVCFRAIDLTSKSVASVPWKLKRKLGNGEIEEVDNHIILDTIKRPNRSLGWTALIQKLIAYLIIAGNSYLERVTTFAEKDIPSELYVLRPDRIYIKVNTVTGTVVGYVYDFNGNKKVFEVDEITGHSDTLHFDLFHPTDDWYGLSNIEPVAKQIDTSNDATDWNKSLMQNQGRPGLLYMVKGLLGQKQYDRLERQLLNNFSGPSNAGKTLILEGTDDAEVKDYGWTPKDLDFIEGDKTQARRISYGLGVPPQLIGIPGDSTYSNYEVARKAFWEDTVIYYLELLKSELNSWIFTDATSDLFLDYDLNNVPALAAKREMLWDKAQKATFLTINEKRKLVGFDADPDGDVLLVPAGMIPISDVGLGDDTGQTEEEVEDDEKLAIAKLMELGSTEEEAREEIGLA